MIIKKIERKEVEIVLDIKFPYYTSNGSHRFKFSDENNCLAVFKGYKNKSFRIEKYDNGIPDEWFALPEISEEQFNQTLTEVVKLISNEP